MRHHRQLKRSEINEIIAGHIAGDTQTDLAARFEVDRSTIGYHIRKFEAAYPEEGGHYAWLKVSVRKVCIHPSGRCTICGHMWDGLLREEREINAGLLKKLKDARSMLYVAGIPWNE